MMGCGSDCGCSHGESKPLSKPEQIKKLKMYQEELKTEAELVAKALKELQK